MGACIRQLELWGVTRQQAGGELPARGVYGVPEPHRRQGVATWLLGQAADWLHLAGVDRLLDYAWLQGTDPGGLDYAGYRAFLPAAGFREIARTRRGRSRAARDPRRS